MAAARLQVTGRTGVVGRVVVAADLQRRGLGSAMLEALHDAVPDEVKELTLVTGGSSDGNLRLYERHGYRVVGHRSDDRGVRLAVMARSPGARGARA